MTKKAFYKVGSLVAILNAEKMRIGFCVVEAADGRGIIIGRCYSGTSMQGFEDLRERGRAILLRMSDLHIIEGRWLVVGETPGFTPKTSFQFLRQNMFGHRFLAEYDGKARLVRESAFDASVHEGAFPSDGVYGCGIVERLLADDLEGNSDPFPSP